MWIIALKFQHSWMIKNSITYDSNQLGIVPVPFQNYFKKLESVNSSKPFSKSIQEHTCCSGTLCISLTTEEMWLHSINMDGMLTPSASNFSRAIATYPDSVGHCFCYPSLTKNIFNKMCKCVCTMFLKCLNVKFQNLFGNIKVYTMNNSKLCAYT